MDGKANAVIVTATVLAIVVAVVALCGSASADLGRTFNSYHAYLTYGDGNGVGIFRDQAYGMAGLFASWGYTTHIYGPGEYSGDAQNGFNNMREQAAQMAYFGQTDELFFWYYSGHGTGVERTPAEEASGWEGGRPDANHDECQPIDPLPGGVSADLWDEGMGIDGTVEGTTIWDDDFGLGLAQIESYGQWVSGAFDMCHAGGMLDGASDSPAWVGKESTWMTSCTEWQTTWLSGPMTNALLGNSAGQSANTLGGLQTWFTKAARENQDFSSQWGVHEFEESAWHTVSYFPVPEPSSLLALGSGLVGLAGFVCRRRPPSPTRATSTLRSGSRAT